MISCQVFLCHSQQAERSVHSRSSGQPPEFRNEALPPARIYRHVPQSQAGHGIAPVGTPGLSAGGLGWDADRLSQFMPPLLPWGCRLPRVS
jgi:hypothetical protein